MNKIVVKDIMIEQNANNSKTAYVSSTNYVLASSTVNEPFNRTLFVSWTLNESYLLKDWATALTNNNANFKKENIKTIQFVNTVPSGSGYTQVSVGATTSAGTTAFVAGTAGVSDIIAYVKANSSDSSKYDVIFYSPVTIYAPVDSSYLFSDLFYMTSITFNNFNTSNVTTMKGMFSGAIYSRPLTSLDLSCFDTSKVTDMSSMFHWWGPDSLTSINLSSFNTSKVTNMSNMFFGCSKLTSLNVSNFDTSKVTDMNNMFFGCEITSLNVSNFDTSKVTNMEEMFASCTSLTSLNLSNFDTSNVTNMSEMFDSCLELTSLDLSNFNTSNVTNMFRMFYQCKSLTSLNLSSFDTSKVTEMDGMFFACRALTSLNLSSFDMSKVTGTNQMLESCYLLRTIKTPKAIGSKAVDLPTETGYSWVDQANTNNAYTQITSACLSKTLVLRENNSYLRKDWQTALINNNANFKQANIKTIQFVKSVPSGSGYTQVSVGATTSAGTTAWIDSSGVYNVTAYVKANGSLYDIIFYSPVTIYAPVDASYLFSNSTYDSSYSNKLKNLVSISFGNFNTSKVTNMSNMFFNCSSLTSLNLSNFDTSKVTNMRYMFNICSSLTSLNLSDFNTSNVTNMSGMFDYCPSLTSLNVSNFNTSNVTNMSYMFDGCSSLTSLNVSSFNTSNVTDMSYMFYNCSKLTSLNLSLFDMSKVTDTGYMLDGCSGLTEIKTPKAIGSAAVDLPTIDKRLWVDNSNVLNIYTQITTSCTNKTLNLVNAPMVTLNSNAQGILKDLDETNGTQITSNNNLNIIYTPEKHIYKLSNTASSDPYATIGQVMYLTAGKKYIMHAEIYSNSGEPITSGSIQVFYAINKGYNEANSKRFSGLSSYETFTVSTTGTYNIRFDNDYGETIWVKNFYVVEETQLTSYVSNNGTYGTLPTPTREYYTFSGWYTAPTGGTNVTETTKISSLNNVTLYAHWTEATYTITIDHNNGTGSTSTIHVPQDPKKQRDYIASLPSISYSGYQFYGLSDSNTAYNASQNLISNLAFSESGLMLCPILRNATVYGVWVPSSTSYEAMFSLYQKLNENDQDYWTFQTYLGTFDSLIHIITHSTTYSGFRCTLGILKDITLSDGYTITNIPSLQVIACFGSRTITFSENNKYFIFNGSYDIKFGGNGRNLTITNSGDDPVCSISTMESMESKLYTQRFVLASGAYINYGITGLSLESSSGNPSPYGYNVLDSFGGTLNHYTIVSPLHRSVNIFGGTVKKIASITGGIYFHNNPDGNIQIDAGENSLNASNSLTFFHTKITSYNVYIDRLNTDGEGFSSKTKVAIAADPTYFNGKVQSSKQYIIYEDKVAYVYPYPVVLDKNGGSGTMPTVSVNSGDKTKFTISTSKTGPLLTKNGKQLYYWSTVSTDTESSQTGVRYDAGYSYTYGGGIHPTVLYATYLTPSADSYFTFTESGSGYIVNYTNKSASLTNCVVPQYHNSKPVIGLADSCFNAASIHGILTLPSSLTSLGYASTGWMRGITKIYFPSNITSMGRCNFVACSAMQDIIINQAANFATYEGVLYSADYSRLYAVPCAKPIGFWKNFTTASYLSLCDSSAYETLSLPSSLKTMEETVFSYNSVKLIRIQSSSLTINSGEFSNCNNLNYILCTNKSVAVYLEGQSANKKGKFFYKTSSYASNISWTLLANNYYISSDGIYAKDPDGNIYRKYETPTGYLDIRNNVVYGFLSTVDATKYVEIDIPAGVTAINASAFQGKTALQTVNFTDTQLNTIGNYAFDGCTSLKTLNGYNRSTRVTSIGSYAFRGTKIERVIIPSTITSIGAGAFANSSAIIAEVYCSYATFGSGLFSGTGLKIIYGASSSSGMYSNLAANLGITKLEYAFFSDSNTNEAGSSLRGKTTNSYYSGTTNPKGLDYTEKTDSTPVPGYLERVRRGITLLNLRYSYAKLYLSFGTYYFSA